MVLLIEGVFHIGGRDYMGLLTLEVPADVPPEVVWYGNIYICIYMEHSRKPERLVW